VREHAVVLVVRKRVHRRFPTIEKNLKKSRCRCLTHCSSLPIIDSTFRVASIAGAEQGKRACPGSPDPGRPFFFAFTTRKSAPATTTVRSQATFFHHFNRGST
jgi:hypothetical protein